jgi:hypothetical protein
MAHLVPGQVKSRVTLWFLFVLNLDYKVQFKCSQYVDCSSRGFEISSDYVGGRIVRYCL